MSFWRTYYHLIWATESRQPLITRDRESELYGYIIGKADAIGCIIHAVGGVTVKRWFGIDSFRLPLPTNWNEGFKDNANMGRLNNQKFVQMPLGKLKDRLQQLCERYGIRLEITEEAYTSKASYLDGDSLPQFGEKPG